MVTYSAHHVESTWEPRLGHDVFELKKEDMQYSYIHHKKNML